MNIRRLNLLHIPVNQAVPFPCFEQQQCQCPLIPILPKTRKNVLFLQCESLAARQRDGFCERRKVWMSGRRPISLNRQCSTAWANGWRTPAYLSCLRGLVP